MDRCIECDTYLETCPCCGVSYCPDCRATEEQLEASLLDEDQDQEW